MRFSIALLLGTVLCAPGKAEDWARFRGPNGTGRSESAKNLPREWGSEQGIHWKVPVLRGSSSPIIAAGKIYLTGYSGYAVDPDQPGDKQDLMLHVFALDFETGKELWSYEYPASEAEQAATKRIVDHGYASPTACTDGKYVIASFGPSGVVGLTSDGEFLWHRDVGTEKAGFGAAASPILFEDLVLMNASIESGTLYALDKTTGEIRWKMEGVERAWTTPALVTLEDGSVELVIHFKNRVLGLDPRSGKQLWFCAGIPDYIVPTPVVDGQNLYFSGGRQNRTLALRAGGRGDVSDQVLWEVPRGANVTSPMFHEGHLYWSHDKAFAQAMNCSDGEVVYQERFKNRERVYASIVYGDGKFYLTQRDGNTIVLAAEPTYRELSVNRLGDNGEQFNATPAIYEDSLVLRSTQFLYRIVASPE